MKKIKNGRQIGYGAAGVAMGVIAYLMLSSAAPTTVEVKSMKEEFLTGDFYNGKEEQHLDEDYDGEVIPLLEYGSYRLTKADFSDHEVNGTIKFGKNNPTFFYKKAPAAPEAKEGESTEVSKNVKETSVKTSTITSNPEPVKSNITSNSNAVESTIKSSTKKEVPEVASTLDNSSGGRKGKILEGFDIHTTKTEEFNVEEIAETFSKSAVLPLDSKFIQVSSQFGLRNDPFSENNAFHAGVDISSTGINNAKVYAAIGGKVTESVENNGKAGLGNYVVIDHGKFQTVYAHMIAASKLKVGDVVQAGDVVGNVGSTGRSTGPHLHFEVGVGGVKFDGLEFLVYVIDKDNNGKVSTEEAEQAGFETPVSSSHWLYKYIK